ncbi:cytochrome P450 [Neofusicoccum parvum]|uniref:Cytochrome P450 n=1 Tax=Neofusicoccum parvum TaxID=310453 RepID=A0ACB5SB76_9PEZI|nr:cytochrome P450 [Neofusicoccum parvum]
MFVEHLPTAPFHAYWLLGIAALLAGAGWLLSRRQRSPNLPTLRISQRPGQLGVADDIAMFLNDNRRFMSVGYERYSKHGKNYTVQLPTSKEVVVAPKFLDEVRSAPQSHVSNLDANMETMQFVHTLHPVLAKDQYHMFDPIKKSLTRSLGPRLPDIVEEGRMSLDKFVGRPKDWAPYNVTDVSFSVITQTANRLLFGPDLARDEEFMDLSIKHTGTVFGGANTIRHWPEILKPLIMWWKTGIYREQAVARRILGPILKDRIATEEMYRREGREAEWAKIKPSDVMQWVLDITPPWKKQVDLLVLRMLNVNIAAIHTSSTTFIDVIVLVALTPEIHDELREEIERVFAAEGGWTKQALTYLMKVDSVMTEAVRVTGGINSVRLTRKTIKDWTMSDGTFLPKGTRFSIPAYHRLRDPDFVENAEKFDCFRMYRRRQDPEKANQHQFVMTSEDNLHFGHGINACPGRFFAANEVKTLLVWMLMRYEIRMDFPGGLEKAIEGTWVGWDRVPPSGTIQLKDRSHLIPESVRKHF